MSEVSRRDLIRTIALSVTYGSFSVADAQHVHQAAAAAQPYRAKALNPHEFATLQELCELVIPGASKGGAAEFIDLLSSQNPELAYIYTGGLAWLDQAMVDTVNLSFRKASPEQKAAMLERIAYRRNETPETAAGIRFFRWVRRMTADAYYTSAEGLKELGFQGNGAVKEFEVPKSAIEYALKRFESA